MGAIDQKIESVTDKIECVTERLDVTPRLLSTFGNSKTVRFGNTGFDVQFYPTESTFDFTPENEAHPSFFGTDANYASILGASLYGLYKLLNDPKEMSTLGIDASRISELSALTNNRLINGIHGLFSRSDVPNLVNARDDRRISVVKIDLQGFKALKSDDPLIKFLNVLSDRTKDRTVTYYSVIG